MQNQTILVLDFGGQYKELIASAVRELGVFSMIKPGSMPIEDIKALKPIGIILTGGPNSVYLNSSPKCDKALFELNIPVLGICYGMQLMCHILGGEVGSSIKGEYGKVLIKNESARNSKIMPSRDFIALMSHRDSVKKVPSGFDITAVTDDCIAAIENTDINLFGVQFHPETKDTSFGKEIFKNFVFDICKATGDYKLGDYLSEEIKNIREKVGNKKVLLALSGGVDSSVCAAILDKAIGKQLTCVFVDHGFMRKNEGDWIESIFKNYNFKFIRINAEDRFLKKLKDITCSEQKRKIVGQEFIKVFDEESKKVNAEFLGQGTIYPDVVESGGEDGKSAVIKAHHNVGGLPDDFDLNRLVEPLRGLFKNEVRALGKKLKLPKNLVHRQPFPGPGLSIRIMGEVTKEKLDVLRDVDAIFRQEVDKLTPGKKPSQYFAVLTNTKSVGVKGDARTYDFVVALRAVTTSDFMTCDYTRLDHKLLSAASKRITNEIASVSRVVFDITDKPPSTVEWE
ncbi:MAG: glutamine-hydrolyzing GMP synthase [Firmicutes bacterium]|nr:glutamine-hydrolyzing GMP synthase [Bacillota bacterium]